MGKQLNFFLLPQDIADFEDETNAIEPMLVVHKRSATGKPVVLRSLQDEGDIPLFVSYLVRREDLSSISMRHVPAQQYWIVDVTTSPVIEFQPGSLNEDGLGRGRLFFIEKYFDELGNVAIKRQGFVKWTGAVWRRLKKISSSDGSFYIGKHAQAWIDIDSGKLRR